MSRADLHPLANLTDAEGKRLDAIIRAVGNRLDRQLRRNGEEPDESDIFDSALAAVVADVELAPLRTSWVLSPKQNPALHMEPSGHGMSSHHTGTCTYCTERERERCRRRIL